MALKSQKGVITRWAILSVAAVIALFPVYWLLITALRPQEAFLTGTTSAIPSHVSWENFSSLFVEHDFGTRVVNSAAVVSLSVMIAMPIGTLAAYALARIRMASAVNETLTLATLAVRALPPIVIIVPIYLMIVRLGLFDSYQGLILPYAAFNLPFVIWMMESFIREIPVELEEAAMTDGSSRLRALRTVLVPLLRPGLAATTIMAVIFTYNDFLFALVLTGTPRAETVTVGAAAFFGRSGADIGQLAAAGAIGVAPLALFVLFLQRHLVRGLTMGAFR